MFSGDNFNGLNIRGAGSTGNLVIGNVFGLDAGGLVRVPNTTGIKVDQGAGSNRMGSGLSAERNVISGNSKSGVQINGIGAKFNLVQGNFIGSDLAFSAVATLGNGRHGVLVLEGPADNLIGGTLSGQGNRIVYNQGDGVAVESGAPSRNAILGNLITDNAGLGIELSEDGIPTLNDPGDGDTGANALLNFPEVQVATHDGTNVDLSYQLDVPPGTYRIEFFANTAPHASGHGQGSQLVHVVESLIHPGGAQAFAVSFPVGVASFVTSTCTQVLGVNTFGHTSEFSLATPTTYAL